jgi:predicted metalloprotease with PDZ domain
LLYGVAEVAAWNSERFAWQLSITMLGIGVMMRTIRLATLLAFCALLSSTAIAQQEPSASAKFPGTITLAVDASEAPAKIFHSKLTIPAKPGPMTLLYPKWIPGEHGPTGPIADLTGLRITAGNQALRWRRDDVNMYALHIEVPQGTTQLDVILDYTSPAELEQGFTAGSTATAQMMLLSWNWVLLYPEGYAAQQIDFRPSLKLPAGWQFGSPLPGATRTGDEVQFAPVSLYTLVDSPVIAGHYFRAVKLTPPNATPAAEMDIASDSAPALQMTAKQEQAFKQLVAEANTLFGATHYRDYHFLFSLSDHVAHFGLEHHESNDSRTYERTFLDPQEWLTMGSLLSHEYTHSWNGKYRRPAGLTTPDYQQPHKGELLWVYEGLTDYLGNVLAGRSGIYTPEQYREALAMIAAQMENRAGRTWRPLIDTAVAAQVLYSAPEPWTNWRRSVDYYPEGDLIWLDADTTIRKLTGGRKSLDDFCKAFHGAPSLTANDVPAPKPYTFDDVVNTLNSVASNDWRKFLEDRLWSTSQHAPLAGVQASGWDLTYNETPSELWKAGETLYKQTDLSYSIGIVLNNENGGILDVVFGSPAAKAGIMPGMKLVAVNDRAWKPETLHDTLKAGKNEKEPLRLLVQNAEYFNTYTVDYHGGDRYPHLTRNANPDTLSEITKQHAKPVGSSQ